MSARERFAASLTAAALLLAPSARAWSADAKLTAEALVARHLEALGVAPSPASGPRVLEGGCLLDIRRGGSAKLEGRTRITSEGQRYRIDLKFDHSAYWGESFAVDGDKVEIGFIQPVRRSPLGYFLNTYGAILKEGLVGGTFSTAWPLIDVAGRKPKLKYEGVKKLGERPVHQLRYKMAKDQGEMSILMSFEADSFLHLGTTYALRLRPGLSQDIQDTAGQDDVLMRLEESFEDFVAVDGLHLPRRWTLKYETGGGASSTFWVWETVLERAAP